MKGPARRGPARSRLAASRRWCGGPSPAGRPARRCGSGCRSVLPLGSPTTALQLRVALGLLQRFELALEDAIASRLFCCWLRSTEQVTVMPVGLWVMRTAVATLFTFCPPGPLARTKATMSRSVSGIVDVGSASSNSGTTVNAAKLVCRLPCALNGLGRTRRCTPGLGAQVAERVFALDVQRDALDAGLLAVLAVDFRRRPSRGARRSRGTCAGASRPSPAPRCRRRRPGW